MIEGNQAPPLRLFDENDRTRTTPADHRQSNFDFLNQVHGPFWGQCRQLAENWFSRFPDSEKADLRSRFRDKSEQQHLGALWELYLHEYLLRCGYQVHAHPLKDQGTKSPDFLATNTGHSFYLEATTIELPKDQQSENALRGAVFDAILRNVRSDHFVLGIEVESENGVQPSTRQLCVDLNSWLGSLDPSLYRPGGDPAKYTDEIPQRTFCFGGWEWTFFAFENGSEPGEPPPRSIILFYPSQGGIVQDYLDLASSLRSKGKRYGKLSHPLLIAIMNPRMLANDDSEIERALFGCLRSNPNRICEGAWNSKLLDDFTPFWANRDGPANAEVAGVLYLGKLDLYHVHSLELKGWDCPWVTSGIPDDLVLRKVYFDHSQCEFLTRAPSVPPESLFGLAPGWPNAEPWP